MKLDVVYELRERLETAAIAGVNLIAEDFRLKKSVQQMEACGKASPVFQKIYQMGLKLVQEECEDRAGVLLDTLGLVDAVLCTQGTLRRGGGLEELELPGGGGELYRQIPYSRMAPVLEALKGTGGGRYAVIREAHEADPEIFQDYRMKYWMVHALGDSYGELAEMVAGWLEKEDERIIPLLKQGFDFCGKREMARRIQVMEKVAGKRENEFYRLAAAEGSREVREAAILALRNDESNLQLLLDLLKTEKGKTKEAVQRAMACMNGPESVEYWKAFMEKKPLEAAGFLTCTTQDWASDLVAAGLDWWFEKYGPDRADDGKTDGGKEDSGKKASGRMASGKAEKEKDSERQMLETLWMAAEGKHSGMLCSRYDKVYRIIPESVREVLARSLVLAPHPDLCRVAEELYQAYGDECLEPVFISSLLMRKPEETFSRFSDYLKPVGVIGQLTGKRKDADGLLCAFSRVRYDEQEGCYKISANSRVVMYRYDIYARRLPEGIDLSWYDLLLNYSSIEKYDKANRWYPYDEIIAALYRPDVAGLQEPYGEYFYRRGLCRLATVEQVRLMKRCGWTKYQGMLKACQKPGRVIPTYRVHELLTVLPMTAEEMASELDEMIVRAGGRDKGAIAYLEQWRDRLRDGGPIL